MKIEIQKIVRPVHLEDYAPEYEGQTLWLWVNPPRQMRMDHWEITQEFAQVIEERATATEAEEPDAELMASLDQRLEDLSRRLYGWFAEMWSQADDEDTHWTTDDVVELVEACLDADPRFWDWLQDEVWRLLKEHREGVKKK